MIYWPILVPVFILGFALGWMTLYQLGRIAAQVEEAIESAVKSIRI